MEQRDQRHRAKERDDGVAHAVAADADEPQRARGPGRGRETDPLPEAPAEGPDADHAGHSEGGRGGTERENGHSREVVHRGDDVGEERFAAAVTREPDAEVGMEPGLV